jgi:hypothetical protein
MTGAPVENAPAKVRDGLVASTLCRPVWSFSWYSMFTPEGQELPQGSDVLQAVADRGARAVCLSMGDSAVPELRSAAADLEVAASFEDLLLRVDCVPAEVMHVGTDDRSDVNAAMRAGLDAIWIHPAGVPSGRGVVRVENLEELRSLLVEGSIRFRTGTTYHEI